MQNNSLKPSIFYPPGGILLWIIIFIEILTFGMGIFAFMVMAGREYSVFHESRQQLNTAIGSINTLLLLTSGYFMAEAVKQYSSNNIDKFLRYLNVTLAGGIGFIILKSIEYYSKIQHGLLFDTNTFFTFYWALTIFHLLHVIVGLIILYVVKYNVKRSTVSLPVEDIKASAAFWHMCDLIWLLIFPILYLYN